MRVPVERAPRTVQEARAPTKVALKQAISARGPSLVHYGARRTPLQHLAHTVGNDRVFAEGDAHERLVETEGTKDRQRDWSRARR